MIDISQCHLADESVCLNESGLLRLRREPVARVMMACHRLHGEIGQAELADATLHGTRKVLGDRQTGQLYDAATLRCLSGPLHLCEIEK